MRLARAARRGAARGRTRSARRWRVRRAAVVIATTVVAIAVLASAAPGASSQSERGKTLYAQSCSSCHGLQLQGIPGRAPRLRGVGAIAADFYLSTGRMPLD